MEAPYIDAEPVVRLNDRNRFEVLVSVAGVPDGLWDNMLERVAPVPTTEVHADSGTVRIVLQSEHQVRGALDALATAIPVVNEAWEERQAIAVTAQEVAAGWWTEHGAPSEATPIPQEVGEGFDYSLGRRDDGAYE